MKKIVAVRHIEIEVLDVPEICNPENAGLNIITIAGLLFGLGIILYTQFWAWR